MAFWNIFKIEVDEGSERNFGLDLVRFVAIVLVLISHGRGLLPDFPWKNLFANGGYFGVELFFVLSGFLIGNILLNNVFDDKIGINFKKIKIFWLRRWFRTLPNYFLFLLLNITVFRWWFGDIETDWRYLFFLQNFAWPCLELMPESWSLSIEEWFYVLMPLFLLIFSKLIDNKRRVVFICLVIYISVFTCFRFVGAIDGNNLWDSGIRKVAVYRLDVIGWGVLMAGILKYYPQFIKNHATKMFLFGACLTGISVYQFSCSILSTMETYFNKSFLFSLTSFGLALMLPYFNEMNSPGKYTRYIISHISIVSYSAYLLHLSFIIPLLARPVFINNLPRFVVYVLYFILTIALSTLIYKYYEKPATALREYITQSEKKSYLLKECSFQAPHEKKS